MFASARAELVTLLTNGLIFARAHSFLSIQQVNAVLAPVVNHLIGVAIHLTAQVNATEAVRALRLRTTPDIRAAIG